MTRHIAAIVLAVLLAAACGSSETEIAVEQATAPTATTSPAPTASAEAPTPASETSAAPAATDDAAPTAIPTAAFTATQTAVPAAEPTVELVRASLPSVEIVDLHTGEVSDLNAVVRGGPLILWFWAPH